MERNRRIFRIKAGALLGIVSHSQIVSTFQPDFRKAKFVWRSRSAFRDNLAIQYSRLVCGIRHRPHECICQKHPETLMIFFNFGKTRSGVPGRSRAWSR